MRAQIKAAGGSRAVAGHAACLENLVDLFGAVLLRAGRGRRHQDGGGNSHGQFTRANQWSHHRGLG